MQESRKEQKAWRAGDRQVDSAEAYLQQGIPTAGQSKESAPAEVSIHWVQ